MNTEEVEESTGAPSLSKETLERLKANEGEYFASGGNEDEEGDDPDAGEGNAGGDDEPGSWFSPPKEAPKGPTKEGQEREKDKGKRPEPFDLAGSILTQVRSNFGEDFKVPEGIAQENFVQKLLEAGQQALHPEVRRMQAAIEQGMDPRSFYQEYGQFQQYLAMDDRDLVFAQLQDRYGKSEANPDGWEEATLRERLDKMDDLEVKERAMELKKAIRGEMAKRDKELDGYASGNRGPDVTSAEYKEQFGKALDGAFEEAFGTSKELFGLKFTSDKALNKAKQEMHNFFFPDAKTGESKFSELMNDRSARLKMAMLYDLAERGVLSIEVSKAEAAASQRVRSTLGGGRPTSSKSGAQGGANRSDFRHFV